LFIADERAQEMLLVKSISNVPTDFPDSSNNDIVMGALAPFGSAAILDHENSAVLAVSQSEHFSVNSHRQSVERPVAPGRSTFVFQSHLLQSPSGVSFYDDS
jgi:hypothetical protein